MAKNKTNNLENFFLDAEQEEANYTFEDYENYMELIVEEEYKIFERVNQEIITNYQNYSIESFKEKLEQLYSMLDDYNFRRNTLVEKMNHLYEQEGNEREDLRDSINACIEENEALNNKWIRLYNSLTQIFNQRIDEINEREREFRNREQHREQEVQEHNRNER